MMWAEPQNFLHKKVWLNPVFLDFGFILSLKAFYQIGTFLKLNDLSSAQSTGDMSHFI